MSIIALSAYKKIIRSLGKNTSPGYNSPRLNLARLNENQKQAVTHTTGPLLILAGAGSGKTSTMAYRIAHLIVQKKVPASQVLGLSFTNKAARELKERVASLIRAERQPAPQGLIISTFHSLCARILREDGQALGYPKSFSIVDASDQRDILRSVFKHIRLDDRRFDLDRVLFEIGQAKSRFISPQDAPEYFLTRSALTSDYAEAVASAYPRYQAELKARGAMDFDDLLFQSVALLRLHADIRNKYQSRFNHILVDEYQDTNPAQFQLLELLIKPPTNLVVVGDDDQSIYSWRGADAAHILHFTTRFPTARVITLDQNYRSTRTILDAANRVIKNNSKRHPKTLWSDRGEGEPIQEVVVAADRDESEWVASEIGRFKRPFRDFAILYRSNVQSRTFEEALRRHRIPYRMVGGYSFLDRKEVKDVLSYWRLIVDPADDSALRRIVNSPARGIGKTSLEKLGDWAFAQNVPLFQAFSYAPTLAPRSADGCAKFVTLITELQDELKTAPDLVAWARRSLERAGIRKAIEEDCEEPLQRQTRWENAEELVHSLGQSDFRELGTEATGVERLREFLNRILLEQLDTEKDEDTSDTQKDEVTLLTLHGSKGLEFPVVFLVGMEDGLLPHQNTIDSLHDLSEERRLCYVGFTRAKDRLILTRAKTRIRYGKPVPRHRSRFLAEAPAELIQTQDVSFTDDFSSATSREAHETKVKDYLAAIRGNLGKK